MPKQPRPESFSRCFDLIISAAEHYRQAFTRPKGDLRRKVQARINRLKSHRTHIIAFVTAREQAALILGNSDL